MSRFLIIAGTGMLGRSLSVDLMADGHEVTILSRTPSKYRHSFPNDIHIRKWDAASTDGWLDAVDGVDVIVNFAGENIAGENFIPDRWTGHKKRRVLESRLLSGQAVVEAVSAVVRKPRLLVQASAVGYYGPRGDELISESEGPGDDFLASVCVAWEAATDPVEKLGVRRIILRTGLVQTLEGGPLPRLVLPFKLFAGGWFGSGRQWWPWIHAADVIRATRYLIDHGSASGPFNLTAPNPLTAKEFSRALGRAMGRPAYLPLPGFAMRLFLGEVATIILDGQRAVPQELENLGFEFTYPEAESALREILG
jgi:uncharacterized protein (TIGR01777 family)